MSTHQLVVAGSFVVYTLAVVVVGLYATLFSRDDDEDYFLAGRSLGPWIAALSAGASSESGWVTLGLVGMAFQLGVQAYWIVPGCLLGFVFNWFVLAGRMNDRARELGAVTVPDLLAFHFRERVPVLRVLSVLIILVSMLLYVAAQMAAAGKAFQGSFGIGYHWGVLIGAAVVLAYTVTGGFRAVCWTDFVQGMLMVGTLVIFPIYLLTREGGLDFLAANLSAVTPTGGGDPQDLTRFWPQASGLALLGFLFGSSALGINFGYPGQPHVVVRFMALRERREALRGGLIAVIWGFFVLAGAVTIGLFARAAFEAGERWAAAIGQDQEMSLVIAAMNLLPGVLGGMVLAAILAAICSTADSQLVVAASAAANDLYARLVERSQRRTHTWINRGVVAALGIGAVLLVLPQKVQVYSFILTYGWAMLGAAFGPQLILLLMWPGATYAGCIAGMLTGFAVALGWPQIQPHLHLPVAIYNLPLAFVAALLVNVSVSLLSQPPGQPAAARDTT